MDGAILDAARGRREFTAAVATEKGDRVEPDVCIVLLDPVDLVQ